MQVDLLKAGAKYLTMLGEKGLDISVRQDFDSIPDAARAAGRDYQLPTFQIDRTDHTRASTFWVFLNHGDVSVGSAAAIRQDLKGENVADYLMRTARHQYPNPSGAAISRVSEALSDKMTGSLAYIGELAIAQQAKGDRVALACFMRLVQILAISEWDIDWTYAFIPHRHLNANLDKLYGFTQRLPAAQSWVEPVPEKRSSTEWWVGAPRAELIEFLRADARLENIL